MLAALPLAAQPTVSNVTAQQRAGTTLVDVAYDLTITEGGTAMVTVRASRDGGNTFETLSPGLLSGAVGSAVEPGIGRSIVWDAGAGNWDPVVYPEVQVEVTATVPGDGDAPPGGFALILPGTYARGDHQDEGDLAGSRPVHDLYVSAFYMGEQPVTYAEWEEVYDWAVANGYTFDNPGQRGADSHGAELSDTVENNQHPVVLVNWYDVVKWCNAKSEREGLTPVYYVDDEHTIPYKDQGRHDVTNEQVRWDANGYRLATEGEWEKAARGGLHGKRWPWGDANIDTTRANYRFSEDPHVLPNGTTAVGNYPANGFGLYDMAGNVSEWTWDWFSDFGEDWYGQPGASEADSRGPASGIGRVTRGGSWWSGRLSSRVAARGVGWAETILEHRGFRLARGFSGGLASGSQQTHSATSNLFELDLLKLISPSITTHPPSQTVATGDSATFSVIASGAEPLSYKWELSTDGGDTWGELEGAIFATFETGATTAGMNGFRYRVRVTDSAGRTLTSDSGILTVQQEVVLEVSEVSAEQRTGTGLVDISYDLGITGDDGTATVVVRVSTDHGSTFETIPSEFLSGAAGPGQSAGIGKTIVWNAGAAGWASDLYPSVLVEVVASVADDGLPVGMVLVEGGTLPEKDANGMGTLVVDSFHIGQYPVTWGEWKQVRSWADANDYDIGSRGEGCADDHPVHSVSWYDVIKWVNAKSEMEGLTPGYTYNDSVYRSGEPSHTSISKDHLADGYRLPLEAEWEFAARGGNKTQNYTYAGSDNLDEVGWYYDNSEGAACDMSGGRGTWPVGQKAPNELSLYDMSGNVWEWCWDRDNGLRRFRGGNWINVEAHCAVSYRDGGGLNPDDRFFVLGFRLARNEDQPEVDSAQSSVFEIDLRETPTRGLFGEVEQVSADRYRSVVYGELEFADGGASETEAFGHSLGAPLQTLGGSIHSPLYGNLTPNPWGIDDWVVSQFFGLVHFGHDAAQYDGWVNSERFDWMKFEGGGGGQRYLWVNYLQTWLAVNPDGSFHSFDFGWMIPQAGSWTRYNTRIGMVTADPDNPQGWLASEDFGFVWFARDGTATWFWSTNRSEWIGITEGGGLWSTAEGRFLD